MNDLVPQRELSSSSMAARWSATPERVLRAPSSLVDWLTRRLGRKFGWLRDALKLFTQKSFIAGAGFEPATFGLCDLTQLSLRVGLYLRPRGALAIQSLRLP
jgi:hypothetical protein